MGLRWRQVGAKETPTINRTLLKLRILPNPVVRSGNSGWEMVELLRSALSPLFLGLSKMMDVRKNTRKSCCAPLACRWFAVLWFLSLACTSLAQSDLRIKDLCRLKGQEENVLQGLGLVVGLKGTGDGDVKPMTRALVQSMQKMGGQLSSDLQGRLAEKEMANAKNVALVFVEVTIPPTGVQQGDKLNCRINAIGAKSLEGGSLMLTPLLGPRADRPIVFALASGPISLEDPKLPTAGKVVQGCKMEMTVANEFVAGNRITLIVDPSHRSIETSQLIEDAINSFHKKGASINSPGSSSSISSRVDTSDLARAIDQTTIEVAVPSFYKDRPVAFVSLILDLQLLGHHNRKRVYIQEREEVVIIGEDVTIAPVAISHKNLTISARSSQGTSNGFVPVSSQDGNLTGSGSAGAKGRPTLKNLNDALNTLNVPTSDIIEIIKALKSQGNLYGELVIE
jgi:flagellar P-ring protein precursor FlgI